MVPGIAVARRRRTRARLRSVSRPLALAAVGWLLVELASLVGLRLLRTRFDLRYRPLSSFFTAEDRAHIEALLRSGEGWYHRLDPLLGWSPLPSGRMAGPGRTTATQNAQGVRSLREYAPTPPEGILRVAAFGDSFVHGDEVSDGEEWASLLERSRPGLEVMNFGVSGYGPDQAWLRWQRDGVGFAPDVVVIGYMTENLLRTQNVFRPSYERGSGFRLAKPRFRLVDDELVLLPNPLATKARFEALLRDPEQELARLGRDDAFFAGSGWHASRLDFLPSVRLWSLVPSALDAPRRARDLSSSPDGEAFRTTRAILLAFCRDVRRTGARPLVAVFPNDADLASLRRGVGRGWQPLVDDLRRGGCPTVDLADGFERDGAGVPVADLFVRWHDSARGNRIVAAALGEAIGALGALGAAGGAAGEEERSAPEASDREPHAPAVGPSRVGRQAGTALDSIVWKGAFGVAMRR
ncbi:MAG: SGNH/GDSL hydrolase family protein [Alphaproteobacteria bacterium]